MEAEIDITNVRMGMKLGRTSIIHSLAVAVFAAEFDLRSVKALAEFSGSWTSLKVRAAVFFSRDERRVARADIVLVNTVREAEGR